jgi:hypothetical protein
MPGIGFIKCDYPVLAFSMPLTGSGKSREWSKPACRLQLMDGPHWQIALGFKNRLPDLLLNSIGGPRHGLSKATLRQQS